MSGPELKACPFCGGKTTVGKWFSLEGTKQVDMWRAECVFSCGRSSDELTRENAIIAWNRRASTSTREAAEEMREALKVRDATVQECPINHPENYRGRIKSGDPCPVCKATSDRPCPKVMGADYLFVETYRAALSKAEPPVPSTEPTA